MNGTRGLITRLLHHSVKVRVAGVPMDGQEVLVPRINLQSTGQTKVSQNKLRSLGVNRGHGDPIHPPPNSVEIGVGHVDQQVPGSDLASRRSVSPTLSSSDLCMPCGGNRQQFM